MHNDADVYPVGVLMAWKTIRGAIRRRMWKVARDRGAYEARFLIARVRNRKWRGLRLSFSGYLAEPPWYVFEQTGLKRAGSGWTRRRALRSLDRHIRRAESARKRAETSTR